jgi:hypothetical protein
MSRKNNVDEINLEVRNIITHSAGGIRIEWNSDIGYGQYDLQVRDGKIVASSESMDSGEDKDFLRKLLSLIADKSEVKS